MKPVTIRVPATTANLGPGFDAFGCALKLYTDVTFEETEYGLEITDHFAQDGLTPTFAATVDHWTEEEFKIWCDYHYSVCREESLLGASNHVIIVGRK